ncbi:MAG: hypothetical protein PVG21_06205 [Gammaproteobacteria bacterium]|jgi:hypothetical protein
MSYCSQTGFNKGARHLKRFLLKTVMALAIAAVPPGVSGESPAVKQPVDTLPSIVGSFRDFWSAAKGEPFQRQMALWDSYVEGPRKALYRSVVWESRNHPGWQQQRAGMLRPRFGSYKEIGGEIPGEAAKIQAALRSQAGRFRQLFPQMRANPRVVIVLAPNFDAKSGVLPDGSPVLALAVDTLCLEHANLSILLPHELFHLYDAEHAGVRNDGVMPNTHLTLPLFAEGLAVYVSTVVAPGHGDGDYLLQPNLGALSNSRLPEAARDFLVDAEAMTLDPESHRVSEGFARWFMGSRTRAQADWPNRAGYWLGLNVIRELRNKYSLQEMASWPPATAQRKVRQVLEDMAQGTQGAG